MPALYPAFDRPLPSADDFDGRSLSSDLGELDRIADSLNLVTLSQLIDARTMALEVLDEDQLPANCPPVRWYEAHEGLGTIQGLLLHLEQHPERLSQRRTALVAELERLATLLEEAKAQNIKFHLLVDL